MYSSTCICLRWHHACCNAWQLWCQDCLRCPEKVTQIFWLWYFLFFSYVDAMLFTNVASNCIYQIATLVIMWYVWFLSTFVMVPVWHILGQYLQVYVNEKQIVPFRPPGWFITVLITVLIKLKLFYCHMLSHCTLTTPWYYTPLVPLGSHHGPNQAYLCLETICNQWAAKQERIKFQRYIYGPVSQLLLRVQLLCGYYRCKCILAIQDQRNKWVSTRLLIYPPGPLKWIQW